MDQFPFLLFSFSHFRWLSSLTLKSSTPSPTASTSPAHSSPRMHGVLGGESMAPRRTIKSWKFRPLQKNCRGKKQTKGYTVKLKLFGRENCSLILFKLSLVVSNRFGICPKLTQHIVVVSLDSRELYRSNVAAGLVALSSAIPKQQINDKAKQKAATNANMLNWTPTTTLIIPCPPFSCVRPFCVPTTDRPTDQPSQHWHPAPPI